MKIRLVVVCIFALLLAALAWAATPITRTTNTGMGEGPDPVSPRPVTVGTLAPAVSADFSARLKRVTDLCKQEGVDFAPVVNDPRRWQTEITSGGALLIRPTAHIEAIDLRAQEQKARP